VRLYRKKPVVIEAIQYTPENGHEILDFIGDWFKKCDVCGGSGEYEGEYGPLGCQLCNSSLIAIRTLENPHGAVYADWNDWIIKGIAGEFYPCKPDIFAATYEEFPEVQG